MGNCTQKPVTNSENTISHSNNRRLRGVSAISPLKGGGTSSDGVWKVKLAIDPKELGQILAEGVNTEALIQQLRIAANSTPRRGKGSQFFTNTCTTLSNY